MACLLLAGCGRSGTPGGAESARDREAARVNALADAYVEAYFDHFPQQATLSGYTEGDHGRLSDNSLEGWAKWRAAEDDLLARLRKVDATALEGSPGETTYGFLRHQLESAVEFRACRMELWNVSPTWTGWQSELALLASTQPISTPEERRAARERFARLPRYLEEEIHNLREGLRLGYSAPKTNVRAVIEQMDALLAAPVSESPFVGMAPDSFPAFRAEMEELERSALRPAIGRYRDFLREVYLAAARQAVGVDANPDGDSCYRAAIRYHATVRVDPREVHETGLREMARIREEMRTVARRSFGTDDVRGALERLRTDPDFLFAGRSEMIEYARSAVHRSAEAVPEWFGRLPHSRVVVQAYPPFQEKSAPGGFYNPPAADGSRPGIYLINTYQAERQSRANVEPTAFHETYPGHHLQGAIALERTDLHPISRFFFLSGFGEGWALYAERLADEMGLYSSDVDRLGMLSAEAQRAARLVVDAGMHALGWTRRRAIDYLRENTALSRASAVAEVDRYIAVPGQATSYMLGSLEIQRLRELAERAQAAEFDIREFHDRVLEDGAVPLPLLARKIERWVSGPPEPVDG
ncbi:MAG: DUF885 family protein [Gemmatimonadota bacterium]